MIHWLNPVAFAALALAAGPLLIHLLRRGRADRLLFPSVRFVRRSATAAMRMWVPSDWLLLLIRMGIISAAVCAAAQPILVTPARVAAWNARTARAVIVDTSASMRLPDAGGRLPADEAADGARMEAATTMYSRQFDSDDIEAAIKRAVRWVRAQPPARREIVVFSDFHPSSFSPVALKGIPEAVGVRLVRVGASPGHRTIVGQTLLGKAGIGTRTQEIALTTRGTAVTTTMDGPPIGALRFAGGADADRRSLLRVVASAGASAPAVDRPIAVRFAGARSEPSQVSPISRMWMVRTVLLMQLDRGLAAVASVSVEAALPEAEPWTRVVFNRDGRPVARAAARDRELLLELTGGPSTLLAAAVLRAALNAQAATSQQNEMEIVQVPQSQLAAFTRPPAPVGQDAWQQTSVSDPRWCWAVALALLLAEQLVRRSRVVEKERSLAA